jgi:pimeloyl-ACP methyl ester carboxylesterase
LKVIANGLEHHVVTWGDENADPVLLVHGFMDAGATWDLVAPAIAAAGFRVLAPDLRGFGASSRVPRGGYYHFPDYVADLAEIAPKKPLRIVGHSMGGTASTLFTGAQPERVKALVLVEGVGPPDNDADIAPVRMRRWLEQLESHHADKPLVSMDDAVQRLRANHPHVPEDVLRSRAVHLVRTDDAGVLRWAFDSLHRTTSPMPFFASVFEAFAARVTCPVLFVGGGELGWHPADEAKRLAAFAHLERVDIDGAGHMAHWTKPEPLANAILDFFAKH